MKPFSSPRRNLALLGALTTLALAPTALAQQANFDGLRVGGNAESRQVDGYTAGFYPLSNITGRDFNGNICTGFASEVPDHIMVLERDFAQLTLQVNSGGNDTTLLVQGPDDSTVRCGQDTSRRNPDASIVDQGWGAGTYKIWVGTHTRGQQYNYRLSISE